MNISRMPQRELQTRQHIASEIIAVSEKLAETSIGAQSSGQVSELSIVMTNLDSSVKRRIAQAAEGQRVGLELAKSRLQRDPLFKDASIEFVQTETPHIYNGVYLGQVFDLAVGEVVGKRREEVLDAFLAELDYSLPHADLKYALDPAQAQERHELQNAGYTLSDGARYSDGRRITTSVLPHADLAL